MVDTQNINIFQAELHVRKYANLRDFHCLVFLYWLLSAVVTS